MADETLKLNLDLKSSLTAMQDMSKGAKELSSDIEKSLGKESVQAVNKLVETSEKGATKIGTAFRNLSYGIIKNLKTAFDFAAVLEGAKFAKGIHEGVLQVFDMERAFDRLNTRLGLTTRQMEKFKTGLGRKAAGAGQKIEDIIPGVEVAAARGGVKKPEELTAIGEMLAQIKATTGEETGGLADAVVEILKNQGEKITAQSFKQTLDALQGTRIQGAFKTAGEAATAIESITREISPEAQKRMGLDTRKMGGLAASATRAGAGGQDVLKTILETAANKPDQTKLLNSILGAEVFSPSGKLNVNEFSKISKKGLGKYTEFVQAQTLGIPQADLARWIDAMKDNMADFKKVTSGADETTSQFKMATNNMASAFDQFRQKVMEAGREIGGSLSKMGNDVIKGDFGKLGEDLKDVGKNLSDNIGTVAAATAITTGVGAIVGGSLGRLFKGIGGGMGEKAALAKDVGIGSALKQVGVTPVFVVNAQEIGNAAEGSGIGNAISSVASGAGVAATAAVAGTILAGVGATVAIADYEKNRPRTKTEEAMGAMWEARYSRPNTSENPSIKKQDNSSMEPNKIEEAILKGMVRGHQEVNKDKKTIYTTPSDLSGKRS